MWQYQRISREENILVICYLQQELKKKEREHQQFAEMLRLRQQLLLLVFLGIFLERKGIMGSPVALNPDEGPSPAVAIEYSYLSSRAVSLANRTSCPGVTPTRVNTTERVAKLRMLMDGANVSAYIVPSGDAHQSEEVAEADQRRRHISGFSGSAGTAVITNTSQALWTDGRYFLQAEDELDCNWILMKEGEPGVPTILEWLKTELKSGAKVGADSTLVSASDWTTFSYALNASGISMVEVTENLVDKVWGANRPSYVQDEVFVHNISYAGKIWQDKIAEVRTEMRSNGADMIIFTALDEIAWLLNLRGKDIPFNPVFRSYVTVTNTTVELFIPNNKINSTVRAHLAGVNISSYDDFFMSIANTTSNKVMIPDAYSYAGGASYAVYSRIKPDARMLVTSPVLFKKALKNPTEIDGMKNAHIKDAVALCDFLSFLEKEIKAGNKWTEISAADKLATYRDEQKDQMGLSFPTISGFGSNGAIIHYEPSNATDRVINSSSLYLLDSGGQYLDGTTDVTRTMHYGTPTPFMIEAYTRVLMGHIDLAMAVFPERTADTRIDILARRPLYEIGLDYNHGTGHGIGMFLGVHEAPTRIRIYGVEDHPMRAGYFFSDEPGYYKDGEFGIRLESIMTVVKANTTHPTSKPMVAFEAVTLVPFEANLIDQTLLSPQQCGWLNEYHKTVQEVIGNELRNQDKADGYNWVKTKTKPLCISSASLTISSLMVILTSAYLSLKQHSIRF